MCINGWNLFWLISVPLCAIMVLKMMSTDMTSAPGVSEMIGFSVRFAVPLIFLVTAISALYTLFPGPLTAWQMRNRKFIGLTFAVAMAWQGYFIYMMSGIHRDYYFENIFFFRDELEGSTGYIFLAAMVLTSFRFARDRLSPQQWRVIHLGGLYFLWAYPFSTYWWTLSGYYDGPPEPHDYVYYWLGFSAFALRIAAWGKKRQSAILKASPGHSTPTTFKAAGALFIASGLLFAAASLHWQSALTGFLTRPAWSANLELWLPYWPFEPFISVILVGVGTTLATQPAAAVQAPATQRAD
jgi:DMSO/TMAO reductase YedYZ heme-binding membrane subunit